MDPFIEDQVWSDFDHRLNVVIADELGQRLDPDYHTRVEERVYMEVPERSELPQSEKRSIGKVPDVALVASKEAGGGTAVVTEPATDAIEPVECLLPEAVEYHESFVVIKDRQSGKVVTIFETLSPTNKRRGSVGNKQYLEKRELILDSPTHLVELDFLWSGDRLPMLSLPPGDYYALVSRAPRRPRVAVYSWWLQQPMPKIPIPLKPDDPEPQLDLQEVVNTVYARACYHSSLDYQRELKPELPEEQSAWVNQLLSHRA